MIVFVLRQKKIMSITVESIGLKTSILLVPDYLLKFITVLDLSISKSKSKVSKISFVQEFFPPFQRKSKKHLH